MSDITKIKNKFFKDWEEVEKLGQTITPQQVWNWIDDNAINKAIKEREKEIIKEFKKMCLVTRKNVGGECKYWDAKSFGYTHEEFVKKKIVYDKFFPEDVLQKLLSASQQKQGGEK